MGLNLRWWRKRPSIHVAEYDITHGCSVIDMDKVIKRLSHPPTHKTVLVDEHFASYVHVGTHLDGFLKGGDTMPYGVVVDKHRSDDWFDPRWVIVVGLPGVRTLRWLEDQLFPRLNAKVG